MVSPVAQPEWLNAAGVWLGLVISLLVFSAILGDHWLARLGQYVLVGSVLGYAVAIVWQTAWSLEFVAALRAEPLAAPWNWLPVALALLLVAGALERIFGQERSGPSQGGWRRLLRLAGFLPVAFLVAMGVAVALVGAVQGTVVPQFVQAARTGFQWNAPLELLLTGILALLITSSALVFFAVDPAQHLANQPRPIQRLMGAWIWLGQRAVWLAAGAVFARLAASRLSLLIAEFDYFVSTVNATGLGQLLATWWRSLSGT
ncbi:MAG: hypothetical protein H3C34_07935 [Caldilineaceae bacterium]|nr:hypothetical protein [Caldilineaceae bacterium]